MVFIWQSAKYQSWLDLIVEHIWVLNSKVWVSDKDICD